MVALGAGIYAGIKERREEIRDLVLTDICPFTLGTGIINRSDRNNPIMSPVIERNSILPSSRSGFYTNSYDNQKHIVVGIYQGEAYYCRENIELGEIDMDILPMPVGESCFELTFTYDINGILEVEVTDLQQNIKKRKLLATGGIRVPEEEVEKRAQKLKAYKLVPPGGIRTKLVLARGERLFEELLGERRKAVAAILEQLQEAMNGRNDPQLVKLMKEAEALFDELEGNR